MSRGWSRAVVVLVLVRVGVRVHDHEDEYEYAHAHRSAHDHEFVYVLSGSGTALRRMCAARAAILTRSVTCPAGPSGVDAASNADCG